MALILIMIRDEPDGSCSVVLQDEPQCQPDQKEFTAAQHIGAMALNAIHRELNDKPKFVDAGGNQLDKKPQLQLVGADELPIH